MADDTTSVITLRMTAFEEKTFGFDYSEEGAIRSGEQVDPDEPREIFVEPDGLTVGPPVVITSNFKDSDGKVIRAGCGVAVRITPDSSITQETTYTVVCRARATGGDKLESGGKLVVTPTIGT